MAAYNLRIKLEVIVG